MSTRYSSTKLIEINTFNLMSKWFSESARLVARVFDTIKEYLDSPDHLVCLLVDEVESLTAMRNSAMSGVEPSDAIRVVNAVLTQIDQVRSDWFCLPSVYAVVNYLASYMQLICFVRCACRVGLTLKCWFPANQFDNPQFVLFGWTKRKQIALRTVGHVAASVDNIKLLFQVCWGVTYESLDNGTLLYQCHFQSQICLK